MLKSSNSINYWYKTPNGFLISKENLVKNSYVCPEDNYHFRIGSKEYFNILLDNNKFHEINKNLNSVDFLQFFDNKSYNKKIYDSSNKFYLTDAVKTVYGKINKLEVIISCMDFGFLGGSMGSVVGEKILRSIDYSIKHKIPFLSISKSGGVRLMESTVGLMQMAKISLKISQLLKKKIPYISLLTDPTTGGVTSSFAMLGDFNIAEPNALIGFAGPKIINEIFKKNMSKSFQTSEFLFENGFLDFLVDRRSLKSRISLLLKIL